jgi:hypothetical protein
VVTLTIFRVATVPRAPNVPDVLQPERGSTRETRMALRALMDWSLRELALGRRFKRGASLDFAGFEIMRTQEDFDNSLRECHKIYASIREKGAKEQYQQILDDVKEVAKFRIELIKSGWLPPREKDILAFTESTKRPCKWSFHRAYDISELPQEAQPYHRDHPSKNDPRS